MNQPSLMPGSLNVASTLEVNTRALWKVTLGFLPAFVNLHKRLGGPQDEVVSVEDEEDESTYSSVTNSMVRSIEISDDVPDVASVSDISDSSYYSSDYSATSGYSQYTSASSGWSAVDPDLQEYSSCYSRSEAFSSAVSTTSTDYKSAPESTYSGSFYDFARKPHVQEQTKEPSKKKVKRWVSKFSKILLGGDDCNHTV